MKLFSIKSLKIKAKKIPVFRVLFSAFLPKVSFAATEFPGVAQLRMLQETISGPVLFSISAILLVVTCYMSAQGEWGSGFRDMIRFTFWISCAGAATSILEIWLL